MSRVFDTDSQVAKSNSDITPPTTGSFVFWVKPEWNSGDSVKHTFLTVIDVNVGTNVFNILKFTDNNLYAGWLASGADNRVVIADTGIFSNGTWVHIGITWVNSGTTTLYINGVSNGTHASPTSESVTNQLNLGGEGDTFSVSDASLADIALWNVALTSANVSSLAGGARPSSITSGLQNYWPFAGTQSPEPDTADSNNMLLSGSPTPPQGGDPPYTTAILPWKRPAIRTLLVR